MIIAECHDYAISGSAVLVLSMWANSPRLAESSAEVDAARLTLRHNIKLLIDAAYSGDELDWRASAHPARDPLAGRLCYRPAHRLFETGGAHAILRSTPLQRFTRDVEAAFHSGVLNWDPKDARDDGCAAGCRNRSGVFRARQRPLDQRH
jgi:acyl-CoA dehydrogenase-like protein